MSELGSKEGQGQDEKTPFFDSSKISDKKATEHFSNVEGAAERTKQAERARIAAEKEAREVHAADIRAASEQMKKAQKAESGKKGGIVRFLFGGWHKIITIVILLGLIAGWIFLIINSPEESYSSKKEKDEAALAAADEVEDNARTVFDINSNEETYREAKNIYESAIEKSDKREKVFLKIMYADFIYKNTRDFDLAVSMLDGIDEEIDTEVAADYYNLRIRNMYFDAGAVDSFQEIVVEAE